MVQGVYSIIEFPVVADFRGDLSFIESEKHIPFEIKRVYYLYNVRSGSRRGGHAHKNLSQVLIAVSGSFSLMLSNGKREEHITLSNPNKGVLIGSNIWREIYDFSNGSVCLVLASEKYSEDDYIRSYQEFIKV